MIVDDIREREKDEKWMNKLEEKLDSLLEHFRWKWIFVISAVISTGVGAEQTCQIWRGNILFINIITNSMYNLITHFLKRNLSLILRLFSKCVIYL